MQITNDFQARYAAFILNKRHATGRLEKLIPVFLRSSLEVYPHQIEATACTLYNPYAGNQRWHKTANRLSQLKQNEFLEKAKLKKQEANEITALTLKAILYTYNSCYFVAEYLVR